MLSISSKHLNFLDLELKENSRKIKLLEIGLEDRRSVDPNLCPKNCKTFLLSISAVFVMQFLLEFTWFLELNWQVNRINSRSRQVTYNNTTNYDAPARRSILVNIYPFLEAPVNEDILQYSKSTPFQTINDQIVKIKMFLCVQY